MQKETGSKTAIGAALLRAAHQLLDNDKKILRDPVILEMIGSSGMDYINQHRDKFFQPASLALRSHIVLRSRYTEHCLEKAVGNGIRTYILLGAGMDTFAYRQPGWANAISIYEADHPASQKEKIKLLEEKKIDCAANTRLIAIDFIQDDILAAFSSSHIEFNQPVFVACLGVLIYLDEKTIEKLFRFVAALPAGSIFIFTASQKSNQEIFTAAAARVELAGEPWISWFEPATLEKQLRSYGFSDVQFLSVDEADQLYYRSGTNLPPPKKAGIVKAVV